MSDEEDSIFQSQFQTRSQSPPRGDDSTASLMNSRSRRSTSGSDRDRRTNANVESDDETESRASAAPSLAELTAAGSRPDPRARGVGSFEPSRREIREPERRARGPRSGERGARRAPSGGREADDRARRRRHAREREETLYEEEDSEEEDGGDAGRGRLGGHARSRSDRKGYSPVNGRKRGSLIARTVLGLFEGVNVKTVVLCILAMVMVVNLVEHRHRSAKPDKEDFVPKDGLVKDATPFQEIKEVESMITPGVRGGMAKVEEAEEDDDDAGDAPVGNIGLYSDRADAGDKQGSKDGAQKTAGEGGPAGLMDGQVLTAQADTAVQNTQQQQQQQQPSGGDYANSPMGGQAAQTGMVGQYPGAGQGAQQQQQQPMQGYLQQQQQPGMVNQFGQMPQQPGMGGQYPQQQMGMGQFGQQQQMAFPNQMAMGNQFGQQPQPMNGQFGMNPMGMGGQFGQQQGYGNMQQPMYPGQIVPPLGQQQPPMGLPQGAGQQAQVDGQYGVQNKASSLTEAAAAAPVAQVAPPVQQAPVQPVSESGVPLLQEVPQGYVPPAVPDTPAQPAAPADPSSDSLADLNNFKDSWDPYEKTDIPMFWHIPKAGGSSIKDALGGCHRFIQATEFGVTDGHIEDTEIAVVYPKVPGGAETDRSPFVNIDSSTVAGIQRAKALGFADSQLADIVVSPFVFECNDLFTQTAKGRLFSVFRHPIDRAISMFYYIQVADWEPSYKPELKEWSLEQYAQSDIVENNWMTRQLSGQLGGELTDANLKKAMEVVRRKFMVGLMTEIEPSMTRFEKFFRWKFKVNPTNQEICRQKMMGTGSNSNKANKKPLPKEGEPAWDLLAHQNNFDLQLYKYIEQLFVEQEVFVAGMPDDFRNIDATCCKCDPPTYPPEGFTCPQAVKNGR